jgi:hypothetical protein
VGEKYKVRIVILNIGIKSGRNKKLVGVLNRRKVNIFCLLETKQKRERDQRKLGSGIR